MKLLANLKFFFALSILMGSSRINAQPNSQIKNTDELIGQKKVIVENYPGVFKEEEINKIEKIDNKHSKIYYTRSNRSFEAIVNSNRKELLLVATFEQIPSDRFPAIVLDSFHKSLDGNSEIQKAFIGTTPSSSDFYRIDVYEKGSKKILKSLFYDNLGRYMQPPY